jgi:hypothetical protein
MGGMEPWRISKDEYAPLLRRFSEYPETPEGRAEAMVDNDARRARERDWEASIGRAVSLGWLDPKTANDRGWYDAWLMKPIPDAPLWHVTTAKRAVLSSGGLKSRRELNQVAGHGLGAGDDTTVSFTANHQTAKDIERAMHEARAAARGEFTVAEMLERADKGTDADHGYASDLRKQLAMEGLDQPVPRVRIYSLKKEGFNTSIGLAAEADIRARGWEPLGKPVVGGDGISRYSNASRPATPEELHEKRLTAYKAFAAYRQFAGGPIDPLFMSVDATAIATMEPEDIAILEGRPANPNVHGKWFDGLSEWRVYTGDAVTVTRVNDEPLQEAREHWFEQLREDDHWRTQPRDPGGEGGGQWIDGPGAGDVQFRDMGWASDPEVPVSGEQRGWQPDPGQLRDTYEGEVVEGVHSKLSTIYYDDDFALVEGRLEDDIGRFVGEFERSFRTEGSDETYVQHESLHIDPRFQRGGIATAFNARAERHYRALGVRRIRLSAAGGGPYAGGYAWARAGYSFALPRSTKGEMSEKARRVTVASGAIGNKRTDHIIDNAPVSDALKERFRAGFLSQEDYDRITYEGPEELRPGAVRDLGRAFDAADRRAAQGPVRADKSVLDGKFEYEWQIAGFGRDESYEVDGRETWLGREVMKNSNWQGVKELD